jgi:hypothetical protein
VFDTCKIPDCCGTGRVSKNAIHLFAHTDRHNVKIALGLQEEYIQDICQISANNTQVDIANEHLINLYNSICNIQVYYKYE